MKDWDQERKIAVLIDAENAQRAVLGATLAELSKHGHILVKRAYGDWSSERLKNWKEPLNEMAITPMQQFSYTQGKNSSDMALVIDAMDLLYAGRCDAFALVSSDSDFTKLASWLRENEKYVFVIGEQRTPPALVNACDDFISVEVLKDSVAKEVGDMEKNGASASQSASVQQLEKELPETKRLVSILKNAVQENSDDDDDGWALLARCGSLIKRQNPDFDTRTYGFAKLGELIKATGLFDVKQRKSGSGEAIFIKDKHNKGG
ncbi:MAG: NYN domain-containing protein [Pseudohongiellaceae bacterium]